MVITNHIRIKFNTLLSGSLIQNIRTERITKLIDDNGSDVVFSSSIGRLIGMFQSMPKVSYVYVLHNSASGFVTCSRKETKSTQFEKSLESDVEIWRESIGLNSSADVLVSLAWTTDDEKRKMIMFPEFLGTDMTFGLNKERRNLVTFVGVDGLNQSFIGCRCWMPSKQTIAYQWAVDIALPMLIGKSTSMRNRIICSDKEKSLNDSIKSSINRPNGNFGMSKFRLDYYHLVTQPINKMVGAIARKSDLFLKKEKVIRYWIKSWFTDVKTKDEFSLSYNQLENYLINNKHILGDFFESAITGLMKSLLSDIESFANHFFLKSVTLGFIGSSIVEGMNQSIKYGAYASKPTMGIDKSSENQVRSAETQALKSYIEVGKSINKVKIFGQGHQPQIF